MAATFTNLSSDDQQVATAANTPVAITMSGAPTPGFSVSGSKVTTTAAGDYFVIAAAQVGGSATGNVYLWPRVNGKDVADSNSIQYISSPQFTAVLVFQGEMTCKAGDVLELIPDQLDPVAEVMGWKLDAAALAEIDRIVAECVHDPVGPEFMAPPTQRAA